jgi:N6-L-threonylcarbamoyladenine synthase/ribosomal-protein-alanine N-acetyltransferase
MTDSFRIRRATAADLDRLVALEAVVFASDAWPEALWRSELESPHTFYLVVETADASAEVVGYAGLLSLPGGHDGDVQTIGLAESARGRGLGRELMRRLHEEARRRGVHEMFLDVRVDNPVAQSLYRSFGYEEIGVRKGYYQPDDVDALVMRLGLPTPEERGEAARLEGSADRFETRPAAAPQRTDSA